MHATLSQQNPKKGNQQRRGRRGREFSRTCFLAPSGKCCMCIHTRTLSLKRTYVWYITAKQFTAISANRGYRGWSLIRVNYQHSGDSNLIRSLKLLLPNDHHQIWQMGLFGPVFILYSHMANMQEQAELKLKV